MRYDIAVIARQFQVFANFINAIPYGTGHINDTFLLTYNHKGQELRYILQRINHSIFKDPPGLMENVVRVTGHIRNKLLSSGCKDVSRRVLTVISTLDGADYHRDTDGNYWRQFLFIEGARTYDVLESLDQAYQAAKAFGEFQGYLADLPGPALIETIPDFHNAQKRYKTFLEVLEKDTCNRAISAKAEIDFLNTNAALFDVLPKLVQEGRITVRTTHNDTKINNVMIDNKTNKGLCVIDLDTVMPGLSLYDFGDIVRTTVSASKEDEVDLSKVRVELARFEVITKGFLDGTCGLLNQVEIDHLVHAGKLLSMIMATRFLTDYLGGDIYYKIHRQGHNLDRCRAQFKLFESLTLQEEKLQQIVRKLQNS